VTEHWQQILSAWPSWMTAGKHRSGFSTLQ
jgi:hypothetical protein